MCSSLLVTSRAQLRHVDAGGIGIARPNGNEARSFTSTRSHGCSVSRSSASSQPKNSVSMSSSVVRILAV